MVEPGTHGSTYGGNPLGCAVSLRALELIEEEDLTAKAEKLGTIFREGVASFKSPIVQKVRGKGLLNAVVIDESAASGRTAWDLCIILKEKGLLVSCLHLRILPTCYIRLPDKPTPPVLQVPRCGALTPGRDGQRSMWRLTRNRRNRHMGTSSDLLLRWSLRRRNCRRP